MLPIQLPQDFIWRSIIAWIQVFFFLLYGFFLFLFFLKHTVWPSKHSEAL